MVFGALGGLVSGMLGARNNSAPNPGMIQPRMGMMGAGMPGPTMHGSVGIAGSALMNGLGGFGGLFGGRGGGISNHTGVPSHWRQDMAPMRQHASYRRGNNLSDMIAQFMQRRMQTTPMEDARTYSPLYEHLFKM
jgi:hypothetical protein